MIARVIAFSARNKFLVLILTAAALLGGTGIMLYAFRLLTRRQPRAYT